MFLFYDVVAEPDSDSLEIPESGEVHLPASVRQGLEHTRHSSLLHFGRQVNPDNILDLGLGLSRTGCVNEPGPRTRFQNVEEAFLSESSRG